MPKSSRMSRSSRQLRQPFAQAAIAVGHVQLLQQPWRAGVGAPKQTRGLLPQCAGKPRLDRTR